MQYPFTVLTRTRLYILPGCCRYENIKENNLPEHPYDILENVQTEATNKVITFLKHLVVRTIQEI